MRRPDAVGTLERRQRTGCLSQRAGATLIADRIR
jgi:hypothetical protein